MQLNEQGRQKWERLDSGELAKHDRLCSNLPRARTEEGIFDISISWMDVGPQSSCDLPMASVSSCCVTFVADWTLINLSSAIELVLLMPISSRRCISGGSGQNENIHF